MQNTISYLISILAFTCISFVTHAEVKMVSANGFKISNKIETSASTSATWLGLTKKVDLWWPKDHSWWSGTFAIETRAGGCFCEFSEDKSAEHMRVVFVDPEKTLRMVGGLGPLQDMGLYGALTWTISSTERGMTIVTLSYNVNGANENGFEQLATIVDQVQAIQLGGLKAYLKQP